MIRTLGLTKDSTLIENIAVSELDKDNLKWYWVDFNNPDEDEIKLLSEYFNFHHLSIEDCLYSLNTPKLDYYENYNFLIFNALNKESYDPIEISLFVGDNFVISYHADNLTEIDDAYNRVKLNKSNWYKGPIYITHQILDKIVDEFFPAIYMIEDKLDKLDNNVDNKSIHKVIDEVFEIRSDLLKLRRIINSMRDLLYRILNSDRLTGFKDHKRYFADIYDHLLKLSEMVDSSREMTSDMRDSYISINSNKMNSNMMVLTVVTSIFIPLTFIAGVYGMNFKYMPELEWRYGYFFVMISMVVIAILLFMWFKRKGWFDR